MPLFFFTLFTIEIVFSILFLCSGGLMFDLDSKIKQLVNEKGDVLDKGKDEISSCIDAAESLTKKMLGCTLVIRNKKFILTNLELYYGGIGDHAHDWYKANFLGTKGVNKQRAEIQKEKGLCLYLNKPGNGNYKRMDIVVGSAGVAISLLVRNVANEDRKLIGQKDGSPNIILRKNNMNILDEDHGQSLACNSIFSFINTHQEYMKNSSQIESRMRYQKGKGYVGLEGPFGKRRWNFNLILE